MNGTNMRCSFLDLNLEQTGETFIASILTCIFNAVFSPITSTGNIIILNVIWKTQELHSPSFMLLFCLAASDLLVGLVCQPLFVAYQIAELLNNFRAYCILRMTQNISGWITVGVSLFTLSAVSIDRLLALILHLRYSSIVTGSRVLRIAIFLWIGNVTVVILRFWVKDWIFIPLVVILLSFLVTAISSLKIFHIVRKHKRQIIEQQQSTQLSAVKMLKCRKSAVTVLCFYGLFLIFYFPFFVTMFLETHLGYTLKVKITYDYTTSIVFANSCLNPIVYCWRIKEIRLAVKNTLRKCRREPSK
ncbi:trace amine-associated receptor 7f-like [Stylophora pistillata]|uniref:trace amine-associated receptor 7f-like n=1 Tax=Stylophora pistillata TaxID=50429 RepID=UPI000C042C35|nr:trace amine-associated receptor 7f-like [Stylophora pistillata]